MSKKFWSNKPIEYYLNRYRISEILQQSPTKPNIFYRIPFDVNLAIELKPKFKEVALQYICKVTKNKVHSLSFYKELLYLHDKPFSSLPIFEEKKDIIEKKLCNKFCNCIEEFIVQEEDFMGSENIKTIVLVDPFSDFFARITGANITMYEIVSKKIAK